MWWVFLLVSLLCGWLMVDLLSRQKAKRTPEWFYDVLFNANDERYIKLFTDEQKIYLINHIKETKPDCLCCPCFAWNYEQDGNISGCRCTLGGIANRNGKGQCYFDSRVKQGGCD